MLRDVFPSLRDLPALIAFYALVGIAYWLLLDNAHARAVVADIVSRASFWQLICAGLLLFVAAVGFVFYQSEKGSEP